LDSAFHNELKSQSKGTPVRRWIKNMLLFSSFLGLVLFNIITLVNDSFHASVKSTLGPLLGDIVRSPVVVKGSPHVMIDKLIKENEELRDKNKRLIHKSSELEKKHATLKNESDRKAGYIQKALKRMANRSIVAATRNIASLPGESIPFLGTTLIVGVTAWDIYDYCENLKDLNVLNDVFGYQRVDQDTVCGIEVPTREEVEAKMRQNLQAAYEKARGQIDLSHKNARDLMYQTEGLLETEYEHVIERINRIKTRTQFPPLDEIWEEFIGKIYDLSDLM